MTKQKAENITLVKTEDEITAWVGVQTTADAPLYDLTKIEIENDEAVGNGYVAYSLAKGQTLPEGLHMSAGKVYGTPVKASETEQSIVFKVRGQNQTIAEFTLRIKEIQKGVPKIEAPKTIESFAGLTLAGWQCENISKIISIFEKTEACIHSA